MIDFLTWLLLKMKFIHCTPPLEHILLSISTMSGVHAQTDWDGKVGAEGRMPFLVPSTPTPYSTLAPGRNTHVLWSQLCSVDYHCERIWILLFGVSRRREKAFSSFLKGPQYMAKRSPVSFNTICCNSETHSLSSYVYSLSSVATFCFVLFCFGRAEGKL